MSIPLCPYCNKLPKLVERKHGPIWLCRPCQAWVGTHRNSPTNKPLGTLANRQLRDARMRVHHWFDMLWQEKARRSGCSPQDARRAGYAWLAKQLGKLEGQCHVAWMGLAECAEAEQLCRRVAEAVLGDRSDSGATVEP